MRNLHLFKCKSQKLMSTIVAALVSQVTKWIHSSNFFIHLIH